MRILIVGAGAVGGYFGALVANAGRDVTFLVRPARAQVLRSDGLRIVGARTLLAVKAYSLDDAMRDLAPAVGSETMIVPLLNGMRHIDLLVARFGERAVLGGVSALAASLDPDGAIRWLSRGQALLRYGERAGGISPRVEALDRELRTGDFDAAASSDIMHDMWSKSMYRDLAAGHHVEGEHIVGDLVDRAHALGVPVPLFEAARVNLRVYEASR